MRRLTSGDVFASEVDRIKRRYREMVDAFKDALMAAGYPPGASPRSPQEQYEFLLRAELAQEPWFAASPEAQKALEGMKRRYSSVRVA